MSRRRLCRRNFVVVDPEPHNAAALPHRVGGTEQSGRKLVVTDADRKLGQSLNDVRQPDESPYLRCDCEGFVGVALGLFQFPLRDGDARTCM